MNWRQQLKRVKHDLHGTFASPATYTRALDGVSYCVSVRLHRKTETIGEGDGFSQVFIEEDRIVLFGDQIRDDPERGDRVYIQDENVTAKIDTVEPNTGPEIFCNVSLVDGQV